MGVAIIYDKCDWLLFGPVMTHSVWSLPQNIILHSVCKIILHCIHGGNGDHFAAIINSVILRVLCDLWHGQECCMLLASWGPVLLPTIAWCQGMYVSQGEHYRGVTTYLSLLSLPIYVLNSYIVFLLVCIRVTKCVIYIYQKLPRVSLLCK